MYNNNSKVNFKITILRSSLCYYSYAYILVKGTILITEAGAGGAASAGNGNSKQ